MASPPLVCIVDDQADFRFLLQQLFKQSFPTYNVRFFDSGYALLDELSGFSPQPILILLDRHMPQFDGHQTLLKLKRDSLYKRIPVVMMSAAASEVEVNDCYEAGVNSFLEKKLDFQALEEGVGGACRY